MAEKFNFIDLVHLYDLVHTLRVSTIPLNEHTDPLSTDDCWNQIHDLLDKLGNTYKDQLYDKESLEKMTGKKIHTYEKQYDKNGLFIGVLIKPITVAEYIDCSITILPNGSSFEESSNNLI